MSARVVQVGDPEPEPGQTIWTDRDGFRWRNTGEGWKVKQVGWSGLRAWESRLGPARFLPLTEQMGQ